MLQIELVSNRDVPNRWGLQFADQEHTSLIIHKPRETSSYRIRIDNIQLLHLGCNTHTSVGEMGFLGFLRI